MPDTPAALLRALFEAAVARAAAPAMLTPHLPAPPRGRTVVVGAGKAAAAMAQAVEAAWPQNAPLSGVVVTRYGYGVGPLPRLTVIEAAHPVPDQAGQQAAARIRAAVQGLSADDLVLCLISGGGSALLAAPLPGITLADKQALNRALLTSGASIAEMNIVRKHLSSLKGGRLALAAAPARLVTLLVSDVPGDDPSIIASGPTIPDPSTQSEARAVLARHHIVPPPPVARLLANPDFETPKPGHPAFAGTEVRFVATPQDALEAAAQTARAAGITPLILGNALEGEAREMGRVMAGIARQCRRHGQPVRPPCVLLSGGETTVTVRGAGLGGRNVEFLLSLAIALEGAPGIHALAADTDGVDGGAEVAGALIGPDTLSRALAAGLTPLQSLDANDAHPFFAALGDQLITGPTRTNVNDFRALLLL
ncbi:glycerate kinase [Acidocella sp.]|uniref:glycerate kinase type-2 family protein n=1 Tax=Acidocella sp. TaxID=50710 RepID=UPI00262F7FC0|nr:glycerate kinase [Acidocella sp.]